MKIFGFFKLSKCLAMFALPLLLVFCDVASGFQDNHTEGVPQLSSRPGAAFTVFLDTAGFNYNGTWLGSTPGNNNGLYNFGPDATFGAFEQETIRSIWAQTSNQYRSFDVNITTVDPFVSSGSDTDTDRQNFYDSQARMMHTIIGPPGIAGWQGSADGLAALGVIDTVQSGGLHTNFMFSQDVDTGTSVGDGTYIGSISSHEGGHTFGLQHQGDYSGGTLVNEYGNGDDAAGNGNYVGIMGNASDRQRVAWRVGSAHDDNNVTFNQNDVQVIMANSGMSMLDSGIGHAFMTATTIPTDSMGLIDVTSSLHAGIISPLDLGAGQFDAIGSDNYTTDFFQFDSDGINAITLNLNNGNDLLMAGIADNGATLRSTLTLFDDQFTEIGTGTEDSSTLSSTYSGLLGAGSYYAQISSFGGHNELTASYDAAQYYDMGGYFLTGSGFFVSAVPEPGSLTILVLLSSCVFAQRRRTRVSSCQ